METAVLIFVIACVIVCAFFFVICTLGGKSKLYCRIFEQTAWFGWEKVIENFDTIRFESHSDYDYEDHPDLSNYRFSLDIDGTTCDLVYWIKDGNVSIHRFPGVENCLSSFDEYHQNIIKEMLSEKFNFIKEEIKKE